MGNKLFLICPFSCIENFIQEKYGENVFFLTSTAAIFNFNEPAYVESVKEFIESNNIEEVVIVNDLSCRFLQKTLQNTGEQPRNAAERTLSHLFTDNHSSLMQQPSSKAQLRQLATLNIQEQINNMMELDAFGDLFMLNEIKLTGLISDRIGQKVHAIEVLKAHFQNEC
jgi:carbonic anhydrase